MCGCGWWGYVRAGPEPSSIAHPIGIAHWGWAWLRLGVMGEGGGLYQQRRRTWLLFGRPPRCRSRKCAVPERQTASGPLQLRRVRRVTGWTCESKA
jgi:hypothetical protein